MSQTAEKLESEIEEPSPPMPAGVEVKQISHGASFFNDEDGTVSRIIFPADPNKIGEKNRACDITHELLDNIDLNTNLSAEMDTSIAGEVLESTAKSIWEIGRENAKREGRTLIAAAHTIIDKNTAPNEREKELRKTFSEAGTNAFVVIVETIRQHKLNDLLEMHVDKWLAYDPHLTATPDMSAEMQEVLKWIRKVAKAELMLATVELFSLSDLQFLQENNPSFVQTYAALQGMAAGIVMRNVSLPSFQRVVTDGGIKMPNKHANKLFEQAINQTEVTAEARAQIAELDLARMQEVAKEVAANIAAEKLPQKNAIAAA